MTAREIIAHLKGVKKSGDGWVARCPSHDDKRPSLSISEGADGTPLVYCHSNQGCTFESVLAKLPTNGNGTGARIVATYDYCAEKGNLLYQAVRFEPKDFRQRRPDGAGGWEWSLNGTRRVPYHLPELLAANPSRTVAVAEGEKDCDRLTKIGVLATTNPGGAGKWRDEYSQYLRDRSVVILPDNDKAGRKHANEVATSLHGVAKSVKVIELPNLPVRGDVSDWLDSGGTVEELRRLKDETPEFERTRVSAPSFITGFGDLMTQEFVGGEEVAFHLCRGEVGIGQSVTNHGKSTIIRNASYCAAAGREFNPIVKGGKPLKTVLLNFEGSGARFQADLKIMAQVFTPAEMENVASHFWPVHAPEIDDEPINLSRHMPLLEAELKVIGPDIVIIDTASAAFTIRSEGDNSEWQALMKVLIRLARKLNCVIVIIHHIGKAKAEDGITREHAHRGRGASSMADFATSIFNLETDAHDKNLITLTCAKRKSGEQYELRMKLDRENRWLLPTDEAPPKPVTNEDRIVGVLQSSGLSQMSTAAIVQALMGTVSERWVKNLLEKLVGDGIVTHPKRGWWALKNGQSAVVQFPIRECTSAQTDNDIYKSNGDNGLDESALVHSPYTKMHECTNSNGYREPTKQELQLAAKNPEAWRRLESEASREN